MRPLLILSEVAMPLLFNKNPVRYAASPKKIVIVKSLSRHSFTLTVR